MGTPHTIGPVSDASYASTQIDLFLQSTDGEFRQIGMGTGFFYRIHGRIALVTNWHVLTGRHPEKPSLMLPGYTGSPTHFQIHLTSAENPHFFEKMPMSPLYDGDQPIWYETDSGGEQIDIAFLMMDLDPAFKAPCVNDFAPYEGSLLTPGRDVAIIGYPFPRDQSNPFPIWKKAMIASEPSFLVNGRLYAYLDTPGRPGMSGSPVFIMKSGFQATPEEVALISGRTSLTERLRAIQSIGKRFFDAIPIVEFAGIYSGSYGDANLDKLALGRFWPVGYVGQIEDAIKKGANPYPPEIAVRDATPD